MTSVAGPETRDPSPQTRWIMIPSRPENVKYFVGVLAGRAEWVDYARRRLEETFGAIDTESDTFPFDFTDYYEKEMGPNLLRRFFSLERLDDPGLLAQRKGATNEIEREAAQALGEVPRPVNLDIGYLATTRVVLASTKDAPHRIYLAGGIYAELTLRVVGKRFEPLPRTYPDFRTEQYHRYLVQLCNTYRRQLRQRKTP